MATVLKYRPRPEIAEEREPVVIVGGFMSSPADYVNWPKKIKLGFERATVVTAISRAMWAFTRNANYQPQLNALDQAVRQARQKTGAGKVWLICHSAGGTIARLWMGEQPYAGVRCNGHRQVRGIIFLGSPYQSYEPNARQGVAFANLHYPGAYYPDIKYVSAIGRSVAGRPNGTMLQRLAFNSYKKVTPQRPEQWGDGVVTLEGSYVPGADNMVLDEVYHVPMFGQKSYGAMDVMPVWGSYLKEKEGVSNSRAGIA